MEDTTIARGLGLPFDRMPGPQDMTSIMSSDPWVDLLWPRHEREFFFEKPDTDLFFPILSRYHRGWLQIQPWPRHPDPIIHPSYAEIRRLTGGDIPLEIVQRIAEVLSVKSASRLEAVAHKRDLAACALMCRAWVPICQAKLFDEVTLRCARDVHELLEFLMDPTSNIRHYIQDLHIPPQALAGAPWIHHLSSLYPYLPNLPREIEGYRNIDSPIIHTINGPLPRGRGPLRSIHQALPRAPPIFSSYIQKLCLNKLHFRKFNDLADLVAELRDLRYLECDGLTIAGSLPQPSRALGFMPEIVMRDCNFSWASIWLYVGQRKGFSPWQERVDPGDDARIGELVRTIGTGFEALRTPLTSTSNRIAPNPRVDCQYHHGSKLTYSISSTQFITLVVMAKDRRLPSTVHQEQSDDATLAALRSRVLYVYKVKIILAFGKPTKVQNYKFYQDIDWRAFDKTAAAFPHLEVAEVDFLTESDCLNFVERSAYGTMLDELFSRNKLVYSIKFKRQPFDWPLGAVTAKVGFYPRFGLSMCQGQVLRIKLQIEAARAYLTGLEEQQASSSADTLPSEDLPLEPCGSGSSRSTPISCNNTHETSNDDALGRNDKGDVSITTSREAMIEEENRNLPDSREDRIQDNVDYEDPTRSRDGRGSERLEEVVSRWFPGMPVRLAFNYSDPALPIIYIC